jgi:hypothetical protein
VATLPFHDCAFSTKANEYLLFPSTRIHYGYVGLAAAALQLVRLLKRRATAIHFIRDGINRVAL